MEGDVPRHHTIFTDGEEPVALKCADTNCYHCPYCFYKTVQRHSVIYHMKNHATVKHKEFTIVRCGLKCRANTHFHCRYCPATLIRREQIIKHLSSHNILNNVTVQLTGTIRPELLPSTTVHNADFAENRVSAQKSEACEKTENGKSEKTEVLRGILQTPVAPPTVKAPQAKEVTAQPPPVVYANNPTDLLLPARHKKRDTVKCEQCNLELKKKNLRNHIRRKHTDNVDTISGERYLRSQCVDTKRGVFAVEKSFNEPATPIHVIKNTWSQTHRSECEVDQCNLNADFAYRSGLLPFECHHIRSLFFCPHANVPGVALSEKELCVMVQNHWFGECRKKELMKKQEDAKLEGAPLSVLLTVGGPQTKLHVSVYEPSVSYHSRLGRVVVAYDTKKKTWHCPCMMSKKACIHKAIGKWHLFETKRDLYSEQS